MADLKFFRAVVVLLGIFCGRILSYQVSKSYSGYRLLRTTALEDQELSNALIEKLEGKNGINIWKYPRTNQSMDFIASSQMFSKVTALLDRLGVEYKVLLNDVEKAIQAQKPSLEMGRQSAAHPMTWTNYHKYNDIYRYCQYLAGPSRAHATGAQVTMEEIGRTSERKPIVLMKVSKGKGNKPAIFIDGGMHAREWISPATATFILEQLTTNTREVRSMLDDFDWYIIPVVNIDGYEFTFDGDRMWRKTRTPNANSRCLGVDPNRNWGYKFGGRGTSSDPCSDIYRGDRAFSVPETRAVRDAIWARKVQIKMYFTIHAYSQLLMLPWGYAREYPSDYNQLMDLANKGKQALEATHNPRTAYKVGTPPDLIYAAAGGSFDWTKGEAGIKYSYAFELRDTGRNGFLLPPNQIRPTGIETFNAIRAMAEALKAQLN